MTPGGGYAGIVNHKHLSSKLSELVAQLLTSTTKREGASPQADRQKVSPFGAENVGGASSGIPPFPSGPPNMTFQPQSDSRFG